MDETMALDDVRAAWDEHTQIVTKALDKIAKLSTAPASDDNSAKIEEWVGKIKESNTAIQAVLDSLEPAPAPEPTPEPTTDPLPSDGGDGSVV